ncbi:MAG: DMT family transporter [Clostridia bacterium]|nr:DMT family transporter [Clostridia bacterium]
MSEEKKGMIAAVCANIIFGMSYLFTKMALNGTEPVILLSIRFTITFIVLNLLIAVKLMKLELKGKKLIGPIVLGILQPVLYFLFENYGLKYTTTTLAGILSSTSPILTAVLGAIFLGEKPNIKQWLCIGVSIVGVLLVSIGVSGGRTTVLGTICLVLAYLSGAFYSILIRRLSKRFSPFELTYVMFLVGFLFFTAFAFIRYGAQTLPMMMTSLSQKSFVGAILYLGIACSVIAYLLGNYSLARLPVARNATFNCIQTVVSVLSGVIIMHDPFSITSGIAVILILLGVWGVNRFSTRV